MAVRNKKLRRRDDPTRAIQARIDDYKFYLGETTDRLFEKIQAAEILLKDLQHEVRNVRKYENEIGGAKRELEDYEYEQRSAGRGRK